MFASEPVYAFHADIAIPPKIATLSLKRFWTGDMTNGQLAERMQNLLPGIILLANDQKEVPFQDLLHKVYHLAYQDAEHRLYVLPEIAKKAEPWPDEAP